MTILLNIYKKVIDPIQQNLYKKTLFFLDLDFLDSRIKKNVLI